MKTEQAQLGQSGKLDEITQGLATLRLESNGRILTASQLDKMIQDIGRVSIEELNIHRQLIILQSLQFESRMDRQESIAEAHQETFQWALTPDSKLGKWLSAPSGCFWVSGKAGSGKSTLMKFIVNSPKSRELLADWAGADNEVVVAAHYFWALGESSLLF
jgi:hypothetical protein